MELLEYLIKNPAQYKTKVDEVELILVNMHDLLNSYRSHQARQTLISLMEQQSKRRSQTIQNIDE
jgi:mediator of RNA polymerase II transcription subunit 7